MKDRDNEKRHHQQSETGHQNQRQPVRLFRNPQFIIDFSQNTVGNEKVFDIFGIFAQITGIIASHPISAFRNGAMTSSVIPVITTRPLKFGR